MKQKNLVLEQAAEAFLARLRGRNKKILPEQSEGGDFFMGVIDRALLKRLRKGA